MEVPAPTSYVKAFVDPHQEVVSQADYRHLLGTAGPIYSQQQFHGNAAGIVSHQFIPAVCTTMNPSSSHARLDNFVDGRTFPPRVVQLPVEQSYNPYQVPVASAVAGGGYGWHQVPTQEHVVYSDRSVPHQKVMFAESTPSLENCYMCQKALPHAHSDTVAQGQRDSIASPLSDSNTIYHSLRQDDHLRTQPIPRVMVTGAIPERSLDQGFESRHRALSYVDPQIGNLQPEASSFTQNPELKHEMERINLQQVDNIDLPRTSVPQAVIGRAADVLPPNTTLMSNIPLVAQPPIWGNPVSYAQPKVGGHPLGVAHYGDPAFPGIDPTILTDRGRPPAEWNDEMLRAPPKMEATDLEALSSSGNMPSSFSPSSRAGDVQVSSNLLFSNQDPWNLRHDTQFPPPRPHRVPSRKEILATKDSFGEDHLGNSAELNTVEVGIQHLSGNSNKDHSSEHSQPAKGLAEEQIRQELQAVAEGVAASVFQASPPSSNPDANDSIQDGEFGISNADMQHKAKVEDVKTKVPEKSNLGFPISDGIGRLQIIKNADLEELKELGSGTFGTVYHGKWRGTDVAIKRINDRCFAGKASEQERMRDDFWNEAIKLADLHHPNVLAFYGVVLDGPDGSVATVTEYMVNGSLRNAFQKNEKSLDKRKRLLIAMDVAFGMEYLHGKNSVHFDLKSDNLLVNLRDPHRPICKVGDLGLSKVKCQTLISGGVRGTLPWMAPELLNGSSSLVSEKVDVFSFGIVLWELLTGEEPYADLHYGAIIVRVTKVISDQPMESPADSFFNFPGSGSDFAILGFGLIPMDSKRIVVGTLLLDTAE
ncbi:hypothetical protein UlMin_002925, partial [Ulmus minor]